LGFLAADYCGAMRVLLGQIVSGKLTEILVKAGFTNNLRTYAWGPRNRVFLRKYFLATGRFGKKPGFFGGSASRTTSIILTKNIHKPAPTKRKKFLAGNSTDIISDERFVVCGSFH
jgi:hypothetical protein